MKDYNDLEKLYIEEQLVAWKDDLFDKFISAITDKKLKDTGELLETFERGDNWTITKNKGNIILDIEFPNHGRFIEIKSTRRERGLRSMSAIAKSAVWGIDTRETKKKRKKGKDARWYTRNVYGSLNNLIVKLQYGYSEATRERMLDIFNTIKKGGEHVF